MNSTSLISRNPDVLATELDGEIVLMSIELGQYFGMAQSGRRIWELLDPPLTLEGLLDRLAKEYEAPPDLLKHDVQVFLQRLESEGLVHIE